MSTGWAGQPPTRRPGTSPICSVRCPTALLPPNAGRQPPVPSRPTDPAGMSRIRQRWAPSRLIPSSATIGAGPWPPWGRQDFSAIKDLPGLSRNGGAWRLIGKRCGLLTGHERRIGYVTMGPSIPRRHVTVGGIRTMGSIEIATPDSACEPGHSRRPSNEEIRVHRSGLPRTTPARAIRRTGHTGRAQPATRRGLGRRRNRFRLQDSRLTRRSASAGGLLCGQRTSRRFNRLKKRFKVVGAHGLKRRHSPCSLRELEVCRYWGGADDHCHAGSDGCLAAGQ